MQITAALGCVLTPWPWRRDHGQLTRDEVELRESLQPLDELRMRTEEAGPLAQGGEVHLLTVGDVGRQLKPNERWNLDGQVGDGVNGITDTAESEERKQGGELKASQLAGDNVRGDPHPARSQVLRATVRRSPTMTERCSSDSSITEIPSASFAFRLLLAALLLALEPNPPSSRLTEP